MHFQSGVPDWPDVLAVAPKQCFIKAFDGSLLAEAKLKWAALGRDPSHLHTDFRYFDYIYPFDQSHTFDELKAIWRINFSRFVDRTYLEQYAAHIDSVEELNEYTDTRMCTDKALLAPYLASCQAAVAVWNGEYRGRVVPAGCRLVICNSPVGNDVPREFYQLAVETDSILGVHPYTKWDHGHRDPSDFQYHSGRWSVNETAYGIRPVYAFTEAGPYYDAAQGWRSDNCLGGHLLLLVLAIAEWIQDVAQTDAYLQGRILGPGALFTSGGFGWEQYQLDTPQLMEVYSMLASEWMPPESDMDATARDAKIREHAQAILNLLAMLFQVRVTVAVLNVRAGPATTFPVVGTVAANDVLGVYEVAASGWYRIDPTAPKWISGSAAYTVRL